MKEQIIRSETDLLKTAVERIVRSEVLEKEIAAQLPVIEELPDSNKVLSGKVSVLVCRYEGIDKVARKVFARSTGPNIPKLYSDCCSSNTIFRWSCQGLYGRWYPCCFC